MDPELGTFLNVIYLTIINTVFNFIEINQCVNSNIHFVRGICSTIKSRKMRWVRYVAHMEERRGTYSVLVGKPDRNRPLGRPRQRWEDNITIIMKQIAAEVVGWNDLAQDRDTWRAVVGAVLNFRGE
jgi:hypothetical protein